MKNYKIGQVVNEFRYHQEGAYFDISDDGATMLIFFKNPTTNEIEQFKAGKGFEIRFIELYGIIMVTTKIGSLNWMDAPYSPHLSQNLTKFQLPNDGQGLGLTLVLVDAASGEIKHMRLLGLSERFTRQMFGAVMENMKKKFNRAEYDQALNRIFSSYQTNQIVKLSSTYCKINQ